MKVLITGVHGFVGSNLVDTLKAQYTIYGLDIVSPAKAGVIKTYGWKYLEQIKSVDTIIHLAGKAHDTKNTSTEKEYFNINVGLTKTIFDYFLKSGSNKFILFSSVKAVADNVSNELIEQETPNPQTPYGKSKLAAEKYIMNQSSVSGLRSSDKKVYILRPCMIHGPGNKGNLNLLFKLAQKGLPWPLGAFENQRSFVSVDNLVYVIKQILKNNIEPGIYQVADDEPLSTNRLIELIAESQNKNSRIWKINKKIIQGFAKSGDFLHLPLNRERLKKLTESYVVSNAKLTKALGISKMPFSAEEGIRKTLSSF